MRCKIYVVPVKDIYHVNLSFPLEDLGAFYASGPQGYLAQLLGHKCEGGLYARLKGRGLAHNFVAGWKNFARGFSFFVLTAQLTEMGERHVDEVVKMVFQYIKLIKGDKQTPIRKQLTSLSIASLCKQRKGRRNGFSTSFEC